MSNQDAILAFPEQITQPATGSTVLWFDMVVNVTAPSQGAPSYFAALNTTTGTATSGNFANARIAAQVTTDGFVFGARVNGQSGYPFAFGTDVLDIGTEYALRAEIHMVAGNANDFIDLYVGPDFSNLSFYAKAQYSGSGTVNDPEFGAMLISQFGSGSVSEPGVSISSMSVSVPEPGTVWIALTSGLLLLRRRSREFIGRFACLAAVGAVALGSLTTATVRADSVAFVDTYSQNFNGLNQTGAQTLTGKGPHPFSTLTDPALSPVITGMQGWYLANPGGSSSSTEYRAQDGSLSGGSGRGVISFGLTNESNRALGALPTSNQISSFGVLLLNTSGSSIPAVDVSFTGQQWRAGGVDVVNTLSFAYGFGGSIDAATTPFEALEFSSPITAGGETALDGNLPANQVPRSATITGLDWADGTTLALRWNMNEVTGQDTGLAIDNLQINAVPEPSTVLLGLAAVVLAGITARGSTRRASHASEADAN